MPNQIASREYLRIPTQHYEVARSILREQNLSLETVTRLRNATYFVEFAKPGVAQGFLNVLVSKGGEADLKQI